MALLDPSHQAFESAKKKLKDSLNDDELFRELTTTSIEDVWETVKEVQKKPYAEQRMRHMGKIGGFLSKIEAYATTIDTFVQVKPDILALIWGPIRILLVLTKNVAQFADAVCSVMEKLGDALPQFLEVVKIFNDSDKLKEALGLFYGDILDFYVILLEFFSLSRRKILFASIWPKRVDKINVVVHNLERHTTLLRSEVTLQHIRAEYEARTRALDHFDQTAEFQQSQKFEALKARISPPSYFHRLDWLLNRSCDGSAKWLIEDKAFSEWLDIAVPTVPLLWLHGIPGAGKTFLAAAALEKIKARHNALFAFASHQSSTTARSILQSLIFQLASESKDAQVAMVESNAREIEGSTKYVSELLKTLLTSSGPAYIVIDGLDEIEADERRILLLHLVDLAASCPAVRMLLSSRPEDDIARMLTSKATEIRVDKRNSGSIRTYVEQRYHNWMRGSDFDQEAQDHIKHLLAPISISANGMFLYARIVLDNAEELTSIQEIERELTVLPLDLNDAYGRILSRINKSPPVLRRNARAILGWIGCAPVPMTRYEMEQALLINSNSDASPSVIASVNFVRICGPIVEVVDEIPQFVHFTVKDRNIDGFIKEADAHYDLTMSILNYLSSDIFSPDTSDEQQLEENILVGKYRLQSFASSQWITLATRCARESRDNPTMYAELRALLSRTTQKLKNDKLDEEAEGTTYQAMDWGDPDVSDMIYGILRFRQDDRQMDWTYDNSSKWVNFDPSTLSTMSSNIFKKLKKLICVGRHKDRCYCATLQKHYGKNIFKCIVPSCGLGQRGFPTREIRNSHVKIHSRPWKCSVSLCPYADIGFGTHQDMVNHQDKVHLLPLSPVSLPLGKFSAADLELIAFELTRAQRVDQLQQTVSYIRKVSKSTVHIGIFQLHKARQLAVKMGSLQMLKILTPPAAFEHPSVLNEICQLSREIVRGRNVAILRWLLDALRSIRYFNFVALVSEICKTDSDDMYTEWETFQIDSTRMVNDAWLESDLRAAERLIPQPCKRSVIFSAVAFHATRKSVIYEERLIRTWNRLIEGLGIGALSRRFLGWSLTELGKSSKSVRLARELLRLGALIDFPHDDEEMTTTATRDREVWLQDRGQVSKGMTTLHFAMRASSEPAAQFVRFLLEQGANPDYGWAGTKPEQEAGAALMEKWLGETWEELVERTRPARLKRKRQERDKGQQQQQKQWQQVEDGKDNDGEEDGGNEEEPTAKRRREIRRIRRGSPAHVGSDDDGYGVARDNSSLG